MGWGCALLLDLLMGGGGVLRLIGSSQLAARLASWL